MKKYVFLVLIVLLFTSIVVSAQDTPTTLEELIPYVQMLEERVATLEEQIAPGVVKATWDGSDLVSTTPDSKVGNYDVEINKFILNKTDDGEDIITVYFQFLNSSTETKSFYWAIDRKTFQNGIATEEKYGSDYNSNYDVEIRPGVVGSRFYLPTFAL